MSETDLGDLPGHLAVSRAKMRSGLRPKILADE
jgi:hypothetical protein